MKSESLGMGRVGIGKLSSFPVDSDVQPGLKLASMIGFVLSTSDIFVVGAALCTEGCLPAFLVFTHYMLITTPPPSPAMTTPNPPNINCPWLGRGISPIENHFLGGIIPHSLPLTDSRQLLFGCLPVVSICTIFLSSKWPTPCLVLCSPYLSNLT